MRLTNEIDNKLAEWEDEATEAGNLPATPKEADIEIKERIRASHLPEIEEYMKWIEREQAAMNASPAEYGTDEEFERLIRVLDQLYERLYTLR